MKKIALTYLVLLLTTLYTCHAQFKKEYDRVKVSKQLKPHFKNFTNLVDKNNIKIDWSKIQAVELVPLTRGIQGYYIKSTGTVIISYYYYYPKTILPLTRKEKDDSLLMTLGHEIGHSQGWEHTDKDIIGLMNPTSKYDILIIRGMGAEQYLINAYKKDNNYE